MQKKLFGMRIAHLNQYTPFTKRAAHLSLKLSFILSLYFLSAFTFPAHAALQSALEVVNCDYVKGWVWDNNAPNTRIAVKLYDVNPTTSA